MMDRKGIGARRVSRGWAMGILAIAVGGGACGGSSSGEASNQSGEAAIQPQTDGLTIHANEKAHVLGAHRLGAVQAVFESKITNAEGNAATSTLRVGEKVFELAHDRQNGVYTIDGRDAALSEYERAALVDLLKKLEDFYVPDPVAGPGAPLAHHVAVLLGELSWLSSNPAGFKVQRFTRVLPQAERPVAAPGSASNKGGEVPFYWGPDKNGPWWNYGPACAFAPPGSWDNAFICPNWSCGAVYSAIVNGTGGADPNCHGDNCVSNNGQRGNWDCQGQCGVGCQAGWHAGVYQDCFEHDVCTDYYVSCDLDKLYAADAFVDSYSGWCGGWRGGGR